MAKAFFKTGDTKRIKQAIREAEDRTGCEIAAVIAESSGRYDRAEDVFGVLFSAVILTCLWLGLPMLDNTSSGAWASQDVAVLNLPLILLIMIGGFALGAFLATMFPTLKTVFIARQEMAEEVAKSAESCFYTSGLRHAKHGAGVLIYLSRFEHMVQVIGDDVTSEYLTDKDWQDIRDALIAGIKQRQPANGFIDAIAILSNKLEGVFLADFKDED